LVLQVQFTQNTIALYSIFIFFVLLLLGLRLRYIRTKYERIFQAAGLVTRLGRTPILIYKQKLGKMRIKLILMPKVIGKNQFEEKAEALESNFDMNIESIKTGKSPRYIEIVLTKQKLPEKITYKEVSSEKVLPADSFYLGLSMEGIVVQNISMLPHMLIAGATGFGKSIFFKQALMSLLESCRHLQMYLIDLKGGLEMIDFAPAPNVKVIKTFNEAVDILKQIKAEMEERFKFLETTDQKQIIPEVHKKERIIVAVDESSILYNEQKQV